MNLADDLRGWIGARQQDMVDLLTELVGIPTENPAGTNEWRAAVAVLRSTLDRFGLESRVIEVPTGAPVVSGRLGEGERTLYFHGHYDVVPAQRLDQYTAKRVDGRIIGRGTADMKGGLVCLIFAAAALREVGGPLDGRIVFHFVPDEETGSVAGSGYLDANDLIDAGAVAMLTAEPTGGTVWHGNKGALTLRVSVAGRESHVGLAAAGVSAFRHMMEIAGPLHELADRLAERGSMTVIGGRAESGSNFNVVPGGAWFSIDRRFNPDETVDGARAELVDVIERVAVLRGARVDVAVLQQAPSTATDRDHPVARTLAAVIEDVTGSPPRFEICPGVLETHWYARRGIPAFSYGPGGLDVAHGPDEHIAEHDLVRCALVHARTAAELLAPSG